MEPNFHIVQDSELPKVNEWLEQFLPDSFKICYTIRETLQGRWKGTIFCTLGWPNILAVGEKGVSKESPSQDYFLEPMCTSAFSPSCDDLETLLNWPGFLDWSKPMILQACSAKNTPAIKKVVSAKGGHCKCMHNLLLEATTADLPPRPVPEGLRLASLDPDLHTDYIMSTWPHSRENTDVYIRALLRSFPSVGLFDENGECIGLEIGNEYGAIGMLHVREEYRGRGLGKTITSCLAEKYFSDGLPVVAQVIKDNESSRRMHTSCGFKEVCEIDWIMYHPKDIDAFLKSIGYNDDHLK